MPKLPAVCMCLSIKNTDAIKKFHISIIMAPLFFSRLMLYVSLNRILSCLRHVSSPSSDDTIETLRNGAADSLLSSMLSSIMDVDIVTRFMCSQSALATSDFKSILMHK